MSRSITEYRTTGYATRVCDWSLGLVRDDVDAKTQEAATTRPAAAAAATTVGGVKGCLQRFVWPVAGYR